MLLTLTLNPNPNPNPNPSPNPNPNPNSNQARCELAAGAQCSAADNECCDADTCRPLPTSAACAAGAGICLSGRCLTAATAVELGVQRDTWPGLSLDPAACPPRDGCVGT